MKSQIQRDVTKVFLNLSDFAKLVKIRYWRNGDKKPPDELHIPAVIETDNDMTNAWNKEKAYQVPSNEKNVKQENIVMFVALEHFNPPPKRRRNIEVENVQYEVAGVSTKEGMLEIELRRLKE